LLLAVWPLCALSENRAPACGTALAYPRLEVMGTSGDSTSGGSIAAQHPAVARTALAVAPTDEGARFNAIRIPLIPVACFRLNDPAFAFDSSFVGPSFRVELAALEGIVRKNDGCPAAVFGHCDPAGSDDLNKTLGDRRAIAIYALLTRQQELWEYLYANPAVGDAWGC
jgi:outer membrane protein OmpA-like peptidoglycan-associated protein